MAPSFYSSASSFCTSTLSFFGVSTSLLERGSSKFVSTASLFSYHTLKLRFLALNSSISSAYLHYALLRLHSSFFLRVPSFFGFLTAWKFHSLPGFQHYGIAISMGRGIELGWRFVELPHYVYENFKWQTSSLPSPTTVSSLLKLSA